MTISRVVLALSGFATILFHVDAAIAQPIEQTVEEHRNDLGEIDKRGDAFVHRASGYVFPGILDQLPARKTTTFGPQDASVYYTLNGGSNGDAWLTVYVYPATTTFEEEISGVEAAIRERAPDLSSATPAGLPPLPPGGAENWYNASFEGIPVLTGYRLARDGDWYVKVRLSVPEPGGDQAMHRGYGALAAVPWTVRNGSKPFSTALRSKTP